MNDSPSNTAEGFPAQPVLLVDGDIVAYRAAAAAEKVKYIVTFHGEYTEYDNYKDAKAALCGSTDSYVWSRKEIQPEAFAIECLESTMAALARRFPEARLTHVYLSGERNFRDTIWRTKKYKGNRTAERPKHLEAVRQALISRWAAVVSDNQEADDDIGIASRLGETVCVSTDKDLDQIPGWHYNFVNDELYEISIENAEAYFWEQVISGDSTDNIPGLPGYGAIKARKYMDEFPVKSWKEGEHKVAELFLDEGQSLEYLEEMIQLVYIRQPN